MNNETQFIHETNLRLAKTILLSEGELLSSLMEMQRRNLFRELGCTGIFEYCQRHLKFCESQANYYRRIAEVSFKVPELKAAVVQGELSISKARRITTVINPTNHQEWIRNAQTMKQKELEKAVSIVNPQAHPIERIRPVARNVSELRVPIDDETDKNLEILKDLLSQKLKRAATLADVIAWAAKETREKFDPEKKAERFAKRTTLSSRKLAPLQPGRHPVPAKVKHEVVLRDGHRCSYRSADGKICGQRKWTDLHHLVPVSEGGLNIANNLQFLCSAHHRLSHEFNSNGRRKIQPDGWGLGAWAT